METEKIIRAILSDDGIIAKPDEICLKYLGKGYGAREDKRVKYSPIEALYLTEIGKMEVFDGSGGKLSFQELLRKLQQGDPNIWRDYVVYRDLRKRRYVVKEGFGKELRFRVFERGKYGKEPAKYLVVPIFEGRDVSIKKLEEWMAISRKMRKELVIAVVDRRNEVIYYKASLVDLRNV
ncbi:MAG TPA: tRNA-intron lyase [Nitrososphaeria archaeon]|nr:MAG: tRNA-intron lyase [Nitrososphaerota archaeon]HDJ67202.1 tRNA-intron lyase [Nitrososphaeria archaeon]